MKDGQLPEWVRPEHLAYAAGFIDADGTITINGAVRKDRADRVYLRPYVGAYGVEREPLDLLQRMFGGSVQIHRQINGKNRIIKSNFVLFGWHAQQAVARDVCIHIFPYLMIKQKQAALVMQLGEVRRNQKDGYAFYTVSDAEGQRRQALRDQIRFLNRKGHLDYA